MLGRGTPTKRTKRPQRAAKAPQTDFFTALCKSDLGVDCVKEFRFCPERRWRFDFAIPKYKIAIEIDGGVWNYGRHNRATGYLADMEKFNAAATLGWLVLKFTPQQQFTRATLEYISKTIKTREDERNMVTDKGL